MAALKIERLLFTMDGGRDGPSPCNVHQAEMLDQKIGGKDVDVNDMNSRR